MPIFKKTLKYLCCAVFFLPFINNVYAFDKKGVSHAESIQLKILGINDFHGQISIGRFEGKEPVGGAAILASYLKQGQAGIEENTIITIMGDLVGASPPASALLHDEPTIFFINSLGNTYCTSEDRMNPRCNIVATLGNHEFDKGQTALFDLIYGSNHPPTDNWYPSTQYRGANYPYISANIINEATQGRIQLVIATLPPLVCVKNFNRTFIV